MGPCVPLPPALLGSQLFPSALIVHSLLILVVPCISDLYCISII